MKNKQIRSLGIVGGNLEAAMLCQQARVRGIQTTLLEPEVVNIATHFANTHMTAPITGENLKKLSMRVDAIVFCTDSIPKTAEALGEQYPLFPSKDGLEMIAGRVQQLQFASELEIPVPTYYHQDNKQAFFEQLEEIKVPFRFYQIFEDYHEVMEVLTNEELADFIFEVNDEATEWLLECIGTYDKILSVTALKDAKGKIVIYPIQDEDLDAEDVKYITMPAQLPKATTQKITRYAKKMMKNMSTEGLLSFKFGMKKNKAVELLHINAGITLGDIATCHYVDYSVYEQYFNLITGKALWEPELTGKSLVTIVLEDDQIHVPQLPYHTYRMEQQEEGAVNIYVSEIIDEI
ncbi:MAG: ATP-grasp domain-containing protein [Cellulosilyticaceae bacterium]